MKKIYSLILLTFLQLLRAQVPTPELLHYKFNTTSTLVTNFASSPPPGTATGTIVGTALTQTGSINCLNALVGAGVSSTSDFLNTGWVTNLVGSWSVSFWTSNNPPSATLFYIFGDNNAAAFRCFTNGVAGTNNWIIRATGLNDILLTGAATASPNLVTVVYDAVVGSSTSYINGVQTATLSQPTNFSITGVGPFKVGAYGANTGLGAGQFLSDFRLYSSTLTPTQVSALFNINVTPTISVVGSPSLVCSGNSATLTANGASTYSWVNGPNTASNVVTPSVNTVYAVQGFNGTCSVTANYTLQTNPSPVITVNSPSICAGASTTLVPSGALTYTFSNGNAVVSPSTTTSYSVTGTSSLGCLGSNTAVATVTVNPLPNISVTSGSICAGNSLTLVPSGASTYTFSNGNAVVSPSTTTSYSVTGTSSLGCLSSNTAVATVTVNPRPSISVTSGSICAGNSLTLVPSGASTYTFSNGNAVVSPSTTTSYSVTGTSSLGCLSSNTAVATVTVSPLPTVTASSSASLICVGQSAVITPSGAATYSINGGAFTISPTVTTTYSITGTSAAGCSNTITFTQNVSGCVGLTALSGSNIQLSVYPNPSNGLFYVSATQQVNISISDISGKIIFNESVQEGTHTLDLTNLSNGLYILKSQSNTGAAQVIRLIKE